MLALELFSWWYGAGWRRLAANGRLQLQRIYNIFSVPLLLRTLFSPWRRIISYPGNGLAAHLSAWADNLVSRLVGCAVRLVVLCAAAIIIVLAVVASVGALVIWPLLPLCLAAAIVKGVTG